MEGSVITALAGAMPALVQARWSPSASVKADMGGIVEASARQEDIANDIPAQYAHHSLLSPVDQEAEPLWYWLLQHGKERELQQKLQQEQEPVLSPQHQPMVCS